MKDVIQNLTDLIGALAEDIEAIKAKLDEKDASDKDEALKRLAVKLEPIVRFAGGKAIDHINDIFRSEETIAAYRKSLGDEVIASLQANMAANEKDMRKHGIPTKYGILLDIRKMLAEHIEESRQNPENGQQNQRQTNGLPCFQKCKAISKRIKSLCHKIPDGWYKNPYVWTGIGVTLVFVTLFVINWMQWHRYREENMRLNTIADKYRVTTSIVQELHPSLAVTVGAYEELTEKVRADSALAVFMKQLDLNRLKGIGKEKQLGREKSRAVRCVDE